MISDTHGSLTSFSSVLKSAEPFDRLIHCGDFLYHGPRNRLPIDYSPGELSREFLNLKNKTIAVRGNCDAKVDLMLTGLEKIPEELFFRIGELEFLVAHGDEPFTRTISEGIVISGHTHIAKLERKDNLVFLNPGSPSIPKDEFGGSYAVIEISDEVTISIHKLNGVSIAKIVL